MVIEESRIHNIMGGVESTGGVRLHNYKKKLKQRFDIIKKLGQGTYGKVQLGINKETGEEVAIKTIKKCKIESDADLVRIRREIQIMSSVQHPNIIHIYEVFENREKIVLVMEYASSGELYDYLSEKEILTEDEARRLFRQIVTAVYYCHTHKICHRDLKLENILLDQSGNAKIADFGLSNVFAEKNLLSTFCGSPLYASPEIVNGTPYQGPEVDCWSLGVLLYTLVYGAMPFDGSNFKRLVKQISNSDYFEPKKPSRASSLIKEMLTVCPKKRANIQNICLHWWVNEGYDKNCLDIAKELAAQTPVRLDLLLSLVPQSPKSESFPNENKQQPSLDQVSNMSTDAITPIKSHSAGSLLQMDQSNNSETKTDDFIVSNDLSPTKKSSPSKDESIASGVKRKEYSTKKKNTNDERQTKHYKTDSKHFTAPLLNNNQDSMETECNSDATVSVKEPKKLKNLSPTSEKVEKEKIKKKSVSPVSSKQEKPSIKLNLKKPDSKTEKSISGNNSPKAKSPVANVPVANSPTKNSPLTNSSAEAPLDSGPPKVTSPVLCSTVRTQKPISPSEESSKHKMKTEDLKAKNNKPEIPQFTSRVPRYAETKRIETSKDSKIFSRALSLDSGTTKASETASKITERRKSKIFETAEKFKQLTSPTEIDKPKKIFIPGVNVGGAKLAFERKATQSTSRVTQITKRPISKIILDTQSAKRSGDDKNVESPMKQIEIDFKDTQNIKNVENENLRKREEEKKHAVSIISGVIGKKPMQRRSIGSPSTPTEQNEFNNFGFKKSVSKPSTPVESEPSSPISPSNSSDEKRSFSKLNITLKSSTLPRNHKINNTQKLNSSFISRVKENIDSISESPSFMSEAAQAIRRISSSSLSPTSTTTFRSVYSRPNSISHQSSQQSDIDSSEEQNITTKPISKSPREYIIPIAVEGSGYIIPKSTVTSTYKSSLASSDPHASKFGRNKRIGSLISNASDEDSPFSSFSRNNDDLFHRRMNRLRSSRSSQQSSEPLDSLSSDEDDDDGFELLTAENLFSTLLSRVRSLTQRLSIDENASKFPSSKLFGPLGHVSSHKMFRVHQPSKRDNLRYEE